MKPKSAVRRRTAALAVVLCLCAAGTVAAQSATGTESGRVGFLELTGGALVTPARSFAKLDGSANAAALGWGITIGYGVMYAQTALVLGLKNVTPFHPHPLNPTPDDKFYLVQAGHTVPSSLAFMGAGYGTAYGLIRLFGGDADPAALWAAYSAAVIMPTFVTMWIPETTMALVLKNPQEVGWPQWFDVGRQVAGAAWSVALSAIAVAVVGDVPWWQAAIIGTVSTGITGALFGMFYR